MTPAKNVDEYLEGLSQDDKKVLQKLRKAIKAAAPKAEEAIKYRIPSYKYKGEWLVFFVVQRNHLSFTTAMKSLSKKFRKELEGYKVSGTTIHFTAEKPLPDALVEKIVKERINEIQEK